METAAVSSTLKSEGRGGQSWGVDGAVRWAEAAGSQHSPEWTGHPGLSFKALQKDTRGPTDELKRTQLSFRKPREATKAVVGWKQRVKLGLRKRNSIKANFFLDLKSAVLIFVAGTLHCCMHYLTSLSLSFFTYKMDFEKVINF